MATGKWQVVCAYDCKLGPRGTVVSTHATYEGARAAAKRSGFDDFLRIKDPVENSAPFTNGRNKAFAEIGARYPEQVKNAANMTAFQQELTSRLGMKIYDYCGVGNGNVTIMPNAPSNVKSLIESIAKAHGVKVNK